MRNFTREVGLYPQSLAEKTRNSIGDFYPNEPTIFAQPSSGIRYTVNLTDDFDKPHTFDQVVALLSTATDEDEIVFNINSAGGYVDSLNMLLGWKEICKARQVHVLMGNASSAASAFFLSRADQYIVGSGATMMIHEYQAGTYGSQSNNERRTAHTSQECAKYIRKTYADFLTEEEISHVLMGVEIYLDSKQITDRLASRLNSSGNENSGEVEISLEDELEHFKLFMQSLSPDDIVIELDDIEKFKKIAEEVLEDKMRELKGKLD